MISRRQFISTTFSILTMPCAAAAQESRQIARIGRLSPLSASATAHIQDAFRERLRDLGWVEGRNLAMYGLREYVDAGGLMFYGTSLQEMYYRAATFVDKVLKGAKPGDLPVEQPTKFELLINVKTAKVLGLTMPRSLLLRADRIVE